MTRKIAIALDDSHHSRLAVDWVMRNVFHRHHDQLHLLYVLPTPAAVGDSASREELIALAESGQAAHSDQAMDTLKKTVQLVSEGYKVSKESVHTDLLAAMGGASGVGESLTSFVEKEKIDMLIVGCRGMGAIKRSLMSFIGLGSVSDYCLHNCLAPTMVIRYAAGKVQPVLCAEANPPPPTPVPKKVLVSTDGSHSSDMALKWALDNLLLPQDHLHIVCAPCIAPLPVLDEPAAVCGAMTEEYVEESVAATEAAQKVVEAYAQAAMAHGVMKTKLSYSVLAPDGDGSSDIASSISKYAIESNADVMVVGCRGLGAVSRSVMSVLGLGSVSDYLVHNGPCPLVVVKSNPSATARTLTDPLGNEGSLLIRVDEDEGEETMKE